MRYSGLLAGLGNPGQKYEQTRHNIGFMLVDKLLQSSGANATKLNGKKFNSELWEVSSPELAGVWLAAKPLTFMNDSGSAIHPLLAWHNLAPAQLVVAHDEIDLRPGVIRFKFGGGMAGHNGLLSITQHLGSKDYYRLRIGVGKPMRKEDTISWVLGRPAPQERPTINLALDYALETLFIFSQSGMERAREFAHAAAKRIERNENVPEA